MMGGADRRVRMARDPSLENPVPVTARLSRRFYDMFGDDNTNELVGLLNVMDATYRDELRALNGANWLRFEARLDQRMAELRAELMGEIGKVRTEMAQMRGELTTGLERIAKEVAQGQVVAIRWFVGLTVTALVSVVLAVLTVLGRS